MSFIERLITSVAARSVRKVPGDRDLLYLEGRCLCEMSDPRCRMTELLVAEFGSESTCNTECLVPVSNYYLEK